MVLGRISELVIRVSGAEVLASWYRTVLGMTEGGQLDSNTWTAKYPGHSVRLVFKVKEKEEGLGTKGKTLLGGGARKQEVPGH